MHGDKEASHYRKIQEFVTDYSPVSISQYESERTGIHLVVVNQEGPKVYGYFALATEIMDDSGAPHTLEHLVFMGSKNYRYKGLLDNLASRAYSRTNAWTANDHTAYTLESAGWEGFAQILPVYLEHVIIPTLTDEGCYTEVHHVDGEGNDAGVVYSEMQAIQNTGDEIMDLRARRLLYPENVGFRYETGGLMENLRVLTPDRIRTFHKEMYQPKNLCLVIVGEIDQDHLLQILDNFEDGILSDVPSPDTPFRRPWVESAQPPAISATIIEAIDFPEEDESMGEIMTALFGPDCNDPVSTAALDIILTYLTGSSVSILENALVEKEGLASSIGYDVDERPNSVIWFQSSGVATDKLSFVENRIFELLKEVSSQPLNMPYLLDCISRQKRQLKFQAESSPDFFANKIIGDFLFGKRDGSTLKHLSSIKEYDILEKWSDDDWRAFLKKWISDAPRISLLGTPSKEMADMIKSNEKARIETRKKDLGPEGLASLAEKLKAAIAKNDLEIPTSILEQFPVPGVASIHFIESITARSGLAKKLGKPSNYIQRLIDQEPSELPLFIQFEHVPTNFVHLTILLGTSEIATNYRPLLPLFLDNFFNTPIVKDGKKIDFEEVVTKLEQDTVNYSIDGGGAVAHPEGLTIRLQVEPEKYATAIEWIRTMMFDSVFDETRLGAEIAKILAELPESRRDGYTMMSAVDTMIHLDKESSVKARNTLVKATYMTRLKKLFIQDSKAVIASLEAIRRSLFTFNNMRILVIANMEKLQEPVKAWEQLMRHFDTSQELLPLIKLSQRFSVDGQNLGRYGAVIIPMPTIDSSFCLCTAKGPTSPTDPILPAIKVAISFLDSIEGPLWNAIRGKGLAYGTNFEFEADGRIQFAVYRSPDAYRAFIAAKTVIESFVNGTAILEPHISEGAISNIITSLVDKQATLATAGRSHFINSVIRDVPDNYDMHLLTAVRNVSEAEIIAAMRDWLIPVFTAGSANIVVTCAPIMKEGICKSFANSGFTARLDELASFREAYGVDLSGDEPEESEDDEDDEDDGNESEDGESETGSVQQTP
ncbi:Uncharacterized protein K3495_g1977 [Podosphaera aphanis]|nr:Uncharacterized protein K3495_g1977 [Podosphaera aphanis]